MHLSKDASGSNGRDAYWAGHWLQAHRSPAQQLMDITWKKLYAMVRGVAKPGHTRAAARASPKLALASASYLNFTEN